MDLVTVGSGVINYQHTSLAPGASFYYRVCAFNTAGNSAFSNEAFATTSQTAPLTPSNLDAFTVSNSQVNLSWADNSNNEEGFKIERKTGVTGDWNFLAAVGSGITLYNNINLVPSTEYLYRVYAYNSVGNSVYSNIDSATTYDLPPAAPSNFHFTSISSTWFNLAWTDNSDNEDGFIIERKMDISGIWNVIDSLAASTETYQDTGLVPGTPYSYRLRAYNNGGSTLCSNTISAWTTQIPPEAPTNLSATATSWSVIDLAWTDNSSNEAGFAIERKTLPGGVWVIIDSVGSDISIFQNTGLLPVTEYLFRVRAYNTAGNSPYSNESGDTTFQQPPTAPSNLLAMTASWSQIDLTWNDNSGNEDGFLLQRKINSSGTWNTIDSVAVGTEAYQDNGLAPLTNYYYRLCAWNGGGNSGWSNQSNTTTQQFLDHFDNFDNWQVNGNWQISPNGYLGNCASVTAPWPSFIFQDINFSTNVLVKFWVNKNPADSVFVQFYVDVVLQWAWGGPDVGGWTQVQCSIPAGSHSMEIDNLYSGEALIDEMEITPE
jgi:predicted phage tail protein